MRDLSTGRLVYNEILTLTGSVSTPRVTVKDGTGNVLLDDAIVSTDFIADAAGTLVSLPGNDRRFWIGAKPGAGDVPWQLIVFETDRYTAGGRAILGEGETRDLDGLSFTFAGLTSIPAADVQGLPGTEGDVLAQLADGPRGSVLTIGSIGGFAVAMAPDEPVTVGDYEYTFAGRREFAGIAVRRDPGSMIIWVATALLLLGLGLTFYTPRRRLWGKLVGGTAIFRGLGGRAEAIEKELRQAEERANRAGRT